MNNYVYKILVVDDMSQIKANFESYKKYLKIRHNLDMEFKVINNEDEYDDKEPFDILMVDYNLKHGFYNSDKSLGNEFIETFRKKNQISKVIFYSSEFEYNTNTKKYKFPFSDKDTFDLINNLQIDKIAAKSNFDMMLKVIQESCEQLDIIPIILSKTLNEYEGKDITVSYTTNEGENILLSNLLQDVIQDNEKGKNFRKELIETVMTVLLNYKY